MTGSETLSEKIVQDLMRDPIDAMKDAELLCTVLNQLRELSEDPSLSYEFKKRLRDDLAKEDISMACADAMLLLNAARDRLQRIQLSEIPSRQQDSETEHVG